MAEIDAAEAAHAHKALNLFDAVLALLGSALGLLLLAVWLLTR